jgi:hypothetical protein
LYSKIESVLKFQKPLSVPTLLYMDLSDGQQDTKIGAAEKRLLRAMADY